MSSYLPSAHSKYIRSPLKMFYPYGMSKYIHGMEDTLFNKMSSYLASVGKLEHGTRLVSPRIFQDQDGMLAFCCLNKIRKLSTELWKNIILIFCE